MNRRYGSILVCFLLMLAGSSPSQAGRTVHVGVYQNSPQVFLDAKGVARGFYVDLLEYIAAQEGWTLNMVAGTWNQGMERLHKGEIDLLTAIAFLDDGSRNLSYNQETVLANWGQLYVADARIQSMLDLEEKTIVGLENDIHTKQFQVLLKQFGIRYQLVQVAEYALAFESLVTGKADAAIVSKTFGLT
ncbi:MAG: transporter substrate-binding domain-containing protein, partial [Magnetococcales bacterium]|nr:transporter substrate-binding domain-containing protein [Magnetococcales bacterium]